MNMSISIKTIGSKDKNVKMGKYHIYSHFFQYLHELKRSQLYDIPW